MVIKLIRNAVFSTIIIIISISSLSAEDKSEEPQVRGLSLELPISDLLDADTRTAHELVVMEASNFDCPDSRYPFTSDKSILNYRACEGRYFRPLIAKIRKKYNVDISQTRVSGVDTEIVIPTEGIPEENQNRVLINLHGGAFAVGGGPEGEGLVESIAVAAIGKIKVISVNYRMYPEHVFPAATNDVVAVYKELLKTYKPNNIGIYGCSAGGRLTALTVVRLNYENLPIPGAVGMLCTGAIAGAGGDSAEILTHIAGKVEHDKNVSYFKHESDDNPLISPGKYPDILKQFPPSLLISSTRDVGLSNVVYTHSQLVKLGVDADLHVYEGLGHGGFLNPQLPEFNDVHNVIAKFFDKHLSAHGEN